MSEPLLRIEVFIVKGDDDRYTATTSVAGQTYTTDSGDVEMCRQKMRDALAAFAAPLKFENENFTERDAATEYPKVECPECGSTSIDESATHSGGSYLCCSCDLIFRVAH